MLVDWVTSRIAISEYPSSKTDLGQFDAVLNLDRFTPYHTTVHHVHLPIIDGHGNEPEEIAGVLRHMHALVERGRVLVHCAAGVSRSPFIIALYLSWRTNLSFDEAVARVALRRRRPLNIDPGLLAIKDDILAILGRNGDGP